MARLFGPSNIIPDSVSIDEFGFVTGGTNGCGCCGVQDKVIPATPRGVALIDQHIAGLRYAIARAHATRRTLVNRIDARAARRAS